MEKRHSNEFVGGWFVGDFDPAIFRTVEYEAAFKQYDRGTVEPRHFHAVATELTIVASGRVRMNDAVLRVGDIAIVRPGESVKFEALEDSATFVLKFPSVPSDKFLDP